MANVVLADLVAWTDNKKFIITSIDATLESQESSYVLARLTNPYDTSTWIDAASTPVLVRKIIAMRIVGWTYQRTYSEDGEDTANYGALLIGESDKLLDGLLDGSIVIPNLPSNVDRALNSPGFYPTDASSASCPTSSDISLGPAKFSMGKVF